MVFKTKKSVFGVGGGISELYERPERPSLRPSAVPSVITAEMVVTGDLQSPGDIQVEGRIIGQIKVNRLVLAEGAAITGDIIAKEVRICGTLKGTVRCQMVTLTETGRVIGDIFHELLAIETGGQLEGRCHRLGAAPETANSPTGGHPETGMPVPGIEPEPATISRTEDTMPRIYANGRDRHAAA